MVLNSSGTVVGETSNCTPTSNCTLREWLSDLNDHAHNIKRKSQMLELAINILNSSTEVSNEMSSILGKKMSNVEKIHQALYLVNIEIKVIETKCNQFDGPDCDGTVLVCDSKCKTCSSISPSQCTSCYGNFEGVTCSVCKSGWNGLDCSTPICDSKCLNCSSPGNCATCSGNLEGVTCSTCKSGWNATDCNTPICDSKCTSCLSPGNCATCSGNWNGVTCSTCKSGWTGSDCTIPLCDLKCTSCSSPGNCATCSGNWNGVTCSVCKSGWTGSDCNTVLVTIGEIASSSILTTATYQNRFLNEIMTGVSLQSGSQPTLLFKGSRDGFSASTFHTKCDNKGATVVIVKSQSGAIFGGYTSKSWATNYLGAYVSDPSAFMFSLISSTGIERFTKLTQENGYDYKNGNIGNGFGYGSSIFHFNSNGPTFGRGKDLKISDNANTASSAANLCFSYCDTTMAQGTETAKSYLTGSYNFLVSEYEVYTF